MSGSLFRALHKYFQNRIYPCLVKTPPCLVIKEKIKGKTVETAKTGYIPYRQKVPSSFRSKRDELGKIIIGGPPPSCCLTASLNFSSLFGKRTKFQKRGYNEKEMFTALPSEAALLELVHGYMAKVCADIVVRYVRIPCEHTFQEYVALGVGDGVTVHDECENAATWRLFAEQETAWQLVMLACNKAQRTYRPVCTSCIDGLLAEFTWPDCYTSRRPLTDGRIVTFHLCDQCRDLLLRYVLNLLVVYNCEVCARLAVRRIRSSQYQESSKYDTREAKQPSRLGMLRYKPY